MNKAEELKMDLAITINRLLEQVRDGNIQPESARGRIVNKCDQYAQEIAIQQRNRDRAVYSINRGKTLLEIKQALLDAPLVTEKPTKQ